ncbi:hypothetical protein RRG08_055640 [Elysia crispata]|uniref:Uncharacterized protein n=1 Tax=Elysia crispata TaxID=231223 RepID=A0AAE1DC31_9GAST|nr:hypothetical protein RRG08_055640 [Elysia crispata]
MKAETDPLYPDKTGSSNTDDNNDNGESSCQEDETSKLLGDSETKVQAEIRPVQNHSARLPVASDTDGLMIPLIKYQRPALARSVSGGNGSVPAKKKHGGKNNQALPNGTLNVVVFTTNTQSPDWTAKLFSAQ